MIRRLISQALALLILASGSWGLAQSQRKMTKSDVEHQIKELSNWGRWGKEDQLGTLNLITAKKRVEAVGLVTRGISVSLARQAETEEAPDNPKPFSHQMLAWGKGEGPWAMDNYSVSYHGLAHTHMDSLCHLFYEGKMYNGFSRQRIKEQGASVLSIHNVRQGILTRGILIDIPALRGMKYLEPGTAIYPEELVAWENRIGVQVEPGDVVFVRTGRWARRAAKGPWSVEKEGMAGLHASCGQWIRRRDIAMLGSDAAADVIPSKVPGISHPVHVLTLHAMGVHIFDNCDLEELSAACKKFKQWHFLIQAAPIPVKGGTGSPLNPIASF